MKNEQNRVGTGDGVSTGWGDGIYSELWHGSGDAISTETIL